MDSIALEFKEDFKYFIGCGLCACIKYFSHLGVDMVQAASTIKKNKYTEIAEAVSFITSMKSDKALMSLEGLSEKYKNDPEVEIILNFVRLILVKTYEKQHGSSTRFNNAIHQKIKSDLSLELKNIRNSNDTLVKSLAENFLTSLNS